MPTVLCRLAFPVLQTELRGNISCGPRALMIPGGKLEWIALVVGLGVTIAWLSEEHNRLIRIRKRCSAWTKSILSKDPISLLIFFWRDAMEWVVHSFLRQRLKVDRSNHHHSGK